ncbi:MAG TPA: extracellular solute-binding protein [Clostridiales bacterium]|nr:extracellular solute-binding protein [Clostridiales bacterium]
MSIKKGLVLLLILCLALGTFTACSKPADNPKPTEQPTTQPTTEPTDEPTPTPEPDPFPGADLGGVTIRVTGMQNPETADEAKKEYWRERQKEVEEKFNIKLEFDALEGVGWNDVPSTIIASIAAGDPILDFGEMSRYYIADLVTNDAILDMTDVVASYNLPKAYYEGGCQWAGRTVGFSRNPMLPFGIIVYNRDMIKAAGMEKTPGEMFKEGKWSLDDFYNYLAELKTKLPEGVNVFGMHALNWARGAAYANDAAMMDPDTYAPVYTSEAFYEIVEFYQKLVADGLAVNATEVTRDDGTIGYDWNPTQNGFVEGQLAMTYGDDWNFATYAATFDFGIVPWPWGSNVTISGDYTTLSDNYRSYYKDNGCYVVIKGAEKKATPKQYMDILFSYMKDEANQMLINREREAKGEMVVPMDAGTPRNFTSELDIELWDWYRARGRFEPTDTTAQSNVFFRALYRVCATNENARTAFEAVVGQDAYALVEAGLVDPANLSPEIREQMEAYALTVTPAPEE